MAATIRAATPSGSSAYCPCHAKASRGHGGDYPRRSSFRKLCVLHLPHKSEPRPRRRLSAPQLLQEALCPAPATQKRAAATAATIRAAAPSGSSAHCTCHAKASRGHGGDYPRRSPFRKLCALHLPRKSEPRPRRRLSAPQLLQEALRTAPAAQKRAAATAATIRAAAPSGSSAYCTCHAKASRGHGGDYPRRSSFRKLCVLRLPRKSKPRPRRRLSAPQLLQEALCTAPAKQHVCEMRCVRWVVWDELCVRGVVWEMSCVRWVVCGMSCVWDELCVRWVVWDEWCVRWVVWDELCERWVVWDELCRRWVVWDELCEMSCVWDELCEMSCVWDELCEMNCVRWIVWDELCEMSGVRWVVVADGTRTRTDGTGDGRDANKKTKTPQWCGE